MKHSGMTVWDAKGTFSIASQSRTMYLKFFGFSEPPFKLSPDPRFFFFSKKHDEAFSHILYGLKERKGFIVIIGEVGTGKTTLCRLLLSKLEPSVRTALLFNPQLSTIELLQSINQDFGLRGESHSKKVLLDELNGFLLDLLAQGGNALLIIDEAQLLSVECLEEIRLLSNLETDQEKLIQILLIGQPELKEKLAMKELRQLKQRISLIYEIAPLDREEVAAYIQARVAVAGGDRLGEGAATGERVRFDSKAIDRIYRISQGYPRLINIVADQALLAAYVADTNHVTDAFVQQANEELRKGDLIAAPSGGTGRAEGRWVPYWAFSFGVLLVLLALLWSRKEGPFSGRQAMSLPQENPVAPAAPEIGSPPAVPPPSASELKPVSDGSSSRPLFDPEGIVRVGSVSETEKGAYLTLMNLWAPLSPEEDWRGKEMDGLLEGLKEKGFASYAVPLDLKKVLLLNTPLLFSTADEKGLHYQVLAKVEGEEAILLDPLEGRKPISLQRLAEKWKGSGILLWKKIEGGTPPFQRDGTLNVVEGSDPSVKKIQELLKKEGLYANEADGFWGPQTRRALLFFQQKEGLEEEGLWGVETEILLAQRSRESDPVLKPKASGNRTD